MLLELEPIDSEKSGDRSADDGEIEVFARKK